LAECEREFPATDGVDHPIVKACKDEVKQRIEQRKESKPVIDQLKAAEKAVQEAQARLDAAEKKKASLAQQLVAMDAEIPSLRELLAAATLTRDELKVSYQGDVRIISDACAGLERLHTCFTEAVRAAASGTLRDPAAVEKQMLQDITVVKKGLGAGSPAEAMTALQGQLASTSVSAPSGNDPAAIGGGMDVTDGGTGN